MAQITITGKDGQEVTLPPRDLLPVGIGSDVPATVEIRHALAGYQRELAELLPTLEQEEVKLKAALPALEAAAEAAEKEEAKTRERYFGMTAGVVSGEQRKRWEKVLTEQGLGRDNPTSPLHWRFPQERRGSPNPRLEPLTTQGTFFYDLLPAHRAELDEVAQATVAARTALREAPERVNRLRARVNLLTSQAEAAENQLAWLAPQRPPADDGGIGAKVRNFLAKLDAPAPAKQEPAPTEPPKAPKPKGR